MSEESNQRRGTLLTMIILLGVLLTVMLVTSCGTSGRMYNVGTGELLPKNYGSK